MSDDIYIGTTCYPRRSKTDMQKALDMRRSCSPRCWWSASPVSVRGLIDPQQASLRFGFPVSDAAGALFYRVYLSRLSSSGLLDQAPMDAAGRLADGGRGVADIRHDRAVLRWRDAARISQARARAARNDRRAVLAPFAPQQILSEPFPQEATADLSEQQAPALIAPWYDLFNIATRGRCPGGSGGDTDRGLRILRRLSAG
jgi:hypothetical protein